MSYDMDDLLETIFYHQRELQKYMGHDTESMTQLEKINYISWNNHAMHGESVEMIDEVGWKPWAKSKHINRDAFVGEGVDVLKFLLNQLIAVGVTPAELYDRFMAKTAVNYTRQDSGYTGLEKDSAGRALDEPSTVLVRLRHSVGCRTIDQATLADAFHTAASGRIEHLSIKPMSGSIYDIDITYTGCVKPGNEISDYAGEAKILVRVAEILDVNLIVTSKITLVSTSDGRESRDSWHYTGSIYTPRTVASA